MRKIIKEIQLYNFDELSKEIQKELIEQKRQELEDDYCEFWLKEDMQEKAEELLKKYFKGKATFKNVFYDLSYCQGSGAMIEFELTYYNKDLTIKQYGHYSHERSFTIDETNLTDKQYQQLEEKIVEMNSELAQYGYKNIEYYWEADEEAIEELREHEFLINGTIYD